MFLTRLVVPHPFEDLVGDLRVGVVLEYGFLDFFGSTSLKGRSSLRLVEVSGLKSWSRAGGGW